MAYYRNKAKTSWYGFTPDDLTGFVEITEAEWNEHLADIAPKEPTAEEQAEAERLRQIASLKAQLAALDYKTLKFIDGALTEEEYAPFKAERASLREQLNELGA